MNQKQSWEETLEKIIRGILSRYEDKFNFDFKAAERSWGKKVGMENFLREEFSSAIKQAIQTREREISEEVENLIINENERDSKRLIFEKKARNFALNKVLSIINNKSL